MGLKSKTAFGIRLTVMLLGLFHQAMGHYDQAAMCYAMGAFLAASKTRDDS